MSGKRNKRVPADGRRFSVRFAVFVLFLLFFASVSVPAVVLTAAAESAVYREETTGIEAELADAGAAPGDAVLYATVGRWFQADPGASGVNAYLDGSLYWQQITLHLKGDADYSGSATVRIPLLSDGPVDSVKEVVLPLDPEAPDAGLTDVSFSVADAVLTVGLELPAFLYIGVTDPSYLAAVPGDTVEPYVPTVGEQIQNTLDGFRDSILEKWSELTDSLMNSGRDSFNAFLLSDWMATYKVYVQDVVNAVYEIVYPFGVFVAIIAWAFSVAAAGFTLNLDPGNRNSIIRAVLQLLIGLTLLSVTPKLLTMILSFANSLKTAIVGQVLVTDGHAFIQLIFSLKIYLSMALLGVMQCVSPLFIGTATGNESTRRFAVGFLKQYGLCCLEMVFVTIYVLIIDRLEDIFNLSSPLYDLVITVVLSVSVFTVDKKFEKMIH